MDRTRTKYLLKEQKLAPRKKLGQNFLVHSETAEKIVKLAGISQEDTVIEVGVGLGALTKPLAEAAKQVIGIETDSGIIRMHREKQELPENVLLIHDDILKTDFRKLADKTGGRLKFVANLPYSISSPFLFKLFENYDIIEYSLIMLQKEVALRLLGQPGTKAYGVPTVLLASCAETKMLMELPPEEFHPRPKVDSSVVRLSFYPVPARVEKLKAVNHQMLRKVVSAAFGQRRKTLLNSLAAGGFVKDKKQLAQIITSSGLSPSIRAERLEIEDFICLTNAINNVN
jgi:16S rRNA (adenine1518-N6/adenine1519-N6)-dimethyltransferase